MRPHVARSTAIAVTVAAALAGCGGGASNTASSHGRALVGLFRVTRGACAGTTTTGSWFRMVQPGGANGKGPYVSNPDSTCADKTVTALSPGTAGGLLTGRYQPQPAHPFGAHGNSAARAILGAQPFFAVAFGVSTNAKDPQTARSVAPPAVFLDGTTLTGELAAWSVSWNGQQFNQGAPRPGGGSPAATGSYDPATRHFTLDWTSRIVGGPFNNFTGVWHLEGTFQKTK